MTTMDTPEAVRAYYQNRYHMYGATAEGMSYRNAATHDDRMDRISKLLPVFTSIEYGEVLDVGCGMGAFLHHNPIVGKYTGIDLVGDYIQEARQRYQTTDAISFLTGDFLSDDFTEGIPNFDITLAIGTLAWQPADTARAILDKMWKLTDEVMCFTALLDRPFSRPTLLYMGKTMGARGITISEGHVPNEAIVILEK